MGKNKKYPRPVTIDKTNEPEVKEEVKAILDTPIEEKKEEPITCKGYVDVAEGTTLNIRKVPSVKPNNQVAILGNKVELTVIDPDNPIESEGELWLRVKVTDEDEDIAYAMKKFIKIIVEA